MRYVTIFALIMFSFPLNAICQSFYDNPFTEAESEQEKTAGSGHSVIIGPNFTMYNLILSRSDKLPDGEKVTTHITDGGAVAPMIMYRSPEQYFFEYHMPKGSVWVGYHLQAQYSSFKADRVTRGMETIDDGVSSAEGDYMYAACLIFGKIGPGVFLTNDYWRAGVGIGLGKISYSGQVLYAGENSSAIDEVNYSSDLLIMTTGLWEYIPTENWVISVEALAFEGKSKSEEFNFGGGSITVGYIISF